MDRRVQRGGWRPLAATRPDSGMVTAEIAVALPAVVLAVAALLWLIGLAVGQGTVVQAAREGARAAARGESAAQVRERVHDVAPDATVTIDRRAEVVRVTASVESGQPFGVLPKLGWRLTSTASAWVEEP